MTSSRFEDATFRFVAKLHSAANRSRVTLTLCFATWALRHETFGGWVLSSWVQVWGEVVVKRGCLRTSTHPFYVISEKNANSGEQCVGSELSTAMTMKNVVFWDIKTQFVLHRRHITSPLQRSASYCFVRFEVFTAVSLKNAVFWDIKTQFVLHRRHITSPLQCAAS
jgi:hypothetical protein